MENLKSITVHFTNGKSQKFNVTEIEWNEIKHNITGSSQYLEIGRNLVNKNNVNSIDFGQIEIADN